MKGQSAICLKLTEEKNHYKLLSCHQIKNYFKYEKFVEEILHYEYSKALEQVTQRSSG